MKANEFVKKYGLDEAKRLLQRADGCKRISVSGVYCFEYDELKRLIESHELVENCGGLQSSKTNLKLLELSLDIGLFHGTSFNADTDVPRLKQAIADVESCQMEGE